MSGEQRGMNQDTIQSSNRALIINLLRKNKTISRIELAKASGLKQATITNIIKDLIARNLVKETGTIEGGLGRKSISLSLNNDFYRVVHIRIARKYLMMGLFDIGWNRLDYCKIDIPAVSDPQGVLRYSKEYIHRLQKEYAPERIIGIGVAVPGPFFKETGQIGLTAEFLGWENISIQQELMKEFNLHTYVEHDANVGALAEWWLDSQMMSSGSMVYIAAGQGIGAGIIVDGKLIRGAIGTAGEIGHASICYDGPKCKCGNNGCLEVYCSTIALLKAAHQKAEEYKEATILTKESTVHEFFDALQAKDSLAIQVFEEVARYLAVGVVNIINCYNPNLVIIGDEWARAGNLLLIYINNYVKEHILEGIYSKVTIEISRLKGDPAFIGAGALVLDHVTTIV